MKANAICLDCGTTNEDSQTGFCINGHDNWLELQDDVELFEQASKKFGASLGEIKDAIYCNYWRK